MAKQRFRESFNTADVWESNHYLNKAETQKYSEALTKINSKRLEESAHDITRIKECADYLKDLLDTNGQKVLAEAVERISKNPLREAEESGHKIWTVPVSRFGNVCANNRVYTDKLWENVLNNQKGLWKGIPGLCDHPKAADDAGELKYACIVWLDLGIDYDNKLIWGTGVFVGPLGRLLQEIIEVGGRVGFSSSGFGEKIPGTDIVNPDTYEIERVADVVINPSQGVYGDLDPENDFLDKTTQAQVINYTKQQPVKEGKEMGNKLNEAEDQLPTNTSSAIVNAVNSAQNQAPSAQQAPTEPVAQPAEKPATQPVAQPAVQPAAQPAAQPEAQPEAQQEAQSEAQPAAQLVKESLLTKTIKNKYIESYLKNEVPMMEGEEKLTNLKKLKEQLEEINDTENLDKVDKIIEDEEAKKSEILKEAESFLKESQLEKVSEAKEVIDTLETNVHNLVCDRESSEKIIKTLLHRNQTLREELEKAKTLTSFKENINKRKQAKSETKIQESLNIVKKVLNQHKLEEAEKFETQKKTINQLSEANKDLERKIRFNIKKFSESQKALAAKEVEAKRLTEKVERLQASVRKLTERAETAENKFNKLREEIEYTTNPTKHLEESSSSKVSSYLNLREGGGTAVKSYYKDLVNKYGEAIIPFRKEILGCRTLTEATRVFLNNRDSIDQCFREAQEAFVEPGIVSRSQRKAYLAEAGMPIAEEDNIEFANKLFQERMQKYNLG